MKHQTPNTKHQISSKLHAPTWLRGVGGVAVIWVSGFNAKAQRREDAEKTGWREGRAIGLAPQFLLPLCVSAPLRLCVKFSPPNLERRFPNRRGAERSAVPRPAGPLHRADDEGFRKNLCAGKIRGVKRPEGRAPGDVMQFDLTENYERGLLRVYIPTPATKGK